MKAMNNLQNPCKIMSLLRMALVCLFVFSLSVPPAYAQANDGADTDNKCTDTMTTPTDNNTMFQDIVQQVQDSLSDLDSQMYNSVEGGVGSAAGAAITLYIAIYGALFAVGIAQATAYDFLTRMIKVAIVGLVASGNSWTYFSEYIEPLFRDGMNDLITAVTTAASQEPGMVSGSPYVAIDNLITQVISEKVWAILEACASTMPYGFGYAFLLGYALIKCIQSLLTACWVYLMALIVQTLLFGIAPMFIVCLLFDRTRHLFQGWLNQLASASLQPILLFAFFALFASLMTSSINNITQVKACQTPTSDTVRGTDSPVTKWGFVDPTTGLPNINGNWSFPGFISPDGTTTDGPVFPIDIINVIIFLLLAELATKFNSVVTMIATNLAGASTDLSRLSGAMPEWMSVNGGAGDGIKGATTPGSTTPESKFIAQMQMRGAAQQYNSAKFSQQAELAARKAFMPGGAVFKQSAENASAIASNDAVIPGGVNFNRAQRIIMTQRAAASYNAAPNVTQMRDQAAPMMGVRNLNDIS